MWRRMRLQQPSAPYRSLTRFLPHRHSAVAPRTIAEQILSKDSDLSPKS